MTQGAPLNAICPHCASAGTRRLGPCSVCGLLVCDHCGNMQHSLGEVKPIHDQCLRDGAGDTFSMIKFVK